MHLGSREKPNLPLTPRPEKPQKQPCVPGEAQPEADAAPRSLSLPTTVSP